MREIKFRAYQDDKMLQQPMCGNYALARFIGFLYEDAPLMQFTGLKDKNGKDAFQDDLAMINGELCIVNFDTHFICGWEFKSTKAGCYTFNSICTHFNNIGCTDFEIIGNIYEHSNLLKQ